MPLLAALIEPVRGEAAAVVGDYQSGPAVVARQRHRHTGRVGVGSHVADRLLRNSIQERLGRGRRCGGVVDVDRRLDAFGGEGRDELADGAVETLVVQVRRCDLDDEAAQVAHAPAGIRGRLAQVGAHVGAVGPTVEPLGGGRQRVRDARQALDDAVVEIPRDASALGVGRVDGALQQPLTFFLTLAQPARHRPRQRDLDEVEQ